jgi:putative membrane protein
MNSFTLKNWVLSALAVGITAFLLPGVVVDGIIVAFIAALVLGIINAFVRPALLLLTLPLNIVTLGIFTFILNALLVILASAVVPGFIVDGFWWALLFSLIVTIVNTVLVQIGEDL